MGTLIAMRYPTKLFANLADHPYVMCSTGRKAWSCWGGKTGGTALRQGRSRVLVMAGVAVGEADQMDDVSMGRIQRRGATAGVVGVVGMGADDKEA